jgi:hypothetical protein
MSFELMETSRTGAQDKDGNMIPTMSSLVFRGS